VLTWPGLTLFADVVEASRLVADTSSRSRKIAILADLLRTLDADEVPIVVGFLSGVPRQGRVGIGYATVYGTQVMPSESPSLRVEDVDRAITEIEASTGTGSSGRRRQLLDDVLARGTGAEADFLRRLLTGELRQGALAGLMADAVAKAAAVPGELARRALMLSGDLTRMAQIAMTEGEPGLKRIGFEIFRPILPMLASTSASVVEAVSGFERASVEWKLDGIRIQIHRREDQVRIYTRNLNEITETLPGIVAAVMRLPVRQVVLDGEALWMSEEGPGSFQHTVSQIDSDAPAEGIVTFLFDLLHVDGEDLLDAPLHERAARLAAIAPELNIPSAQTSDPAEGERVLEASLRAGHEGVVVKDAASVYAAGRRGKAWRKVKPVRTYDLVVLGAEWGHGRRRGWLSNLHLGARDPRSGRFVMVGKCFKGLTDELLRWQTDALLALETERRGIAVLVRPELVVEIALDGVQSSTRYPGGVALRFARVKRYRPDKSADEADVIDDLRALLRSPQNRSDDPGTASAQEVDPG
jgi:DNA ligase-1